ncbi:unnamed protein product, partial [Owenia fusiformis]
PKQSMQGNPLQSMHGDPMQSMHGDFIQNMHGNPMQSMQGDFMQSMQGDFIQSMHGSPMQSMQGDFMQIMQDHKQRMQGDTMQSVLENSLETIQGDSMQRMLSDPMQSTHGEFMQSMQGDSMESMQGDSMQSMQGYSKQTTQESDKLNIAPVKNSKQVNVNSEQNPEATGQFCPKCGKDFGKNKSGECNFEMETLLNHKCENKFLIKGKRINCINCRWGFPDLVSLQLHARQVHPAEATYNCTHCDTVCSTWLELIGHWKQHPFVKCLICSKEFKDYKYLMSHRYYAHPVQRKKRSSVLCNVCGKTYMTRGGYRTHYDLAHAEQKFKCDFCPKTFGSEVTKKRHLADTHIKNMVCHTCGKLFTTRKRLKSHQTSHSSEKKFKCYICGNKFKYESAVYMHMRTVHKHDKAIKNKIYKLTS